MASQVNGCLSYSDKVSDGFYRIQGMDPFIWTLCTDVQQDGGRWSATARR